MVDKLPSVRIVLPVTALVANPWNPNKETPETFDRVKANITKYGFIDPVLVRKKNDTEYEIIDGEHRWRAATEMGFAEVPCEVIDVDSFDAALLTINMNNLRGEDDPVKRGKIFKQLKNERPDLIPMLPFDENQVAAEVALLDFSFEEEYKDKPFEPKTLSGTTGFTFNVPNEQAEFVSRVLAAVNKDKDQAFITLINERARWDGTK